MGTAAMRWQDRQNERDRRRSVVCLALTLFVVKPYLVSSILTITPYDLIRAKASTITANVYLSSFKRSEESAHYQTRQIIFKPFINALQRSNHQDSAAIKRKTIQIRRLDFKSVVSPFWTT